MGDSTVFSCKIITIVMLLYIKSCKKIIKEKWV